MHNADCGLERHPEFPRQLHQRRVPYLFLPGYQRLGRVGAIEQQVVAGIFDDLVPQGRRPILACLDALPPPASLLYAFSLRARGSEAIRLEVCGLEPAAMLGYLQSVAPETVPAAGEVSSLFEGAERLHLSFDVTDAVLPRISVRIP